MYFIEKLIKIYLNIKGKKDSPVIVGDDDSQELEDIVTCKHNFMPIDSTGEILACSKCGYLIRKKRLKKKT